MQHLTRELQWTEILDDSDHNDNDDVTCLTYLYNVLHRSRLFPLFFLHILFYLY
jgi:hypothetical protein